VQREREVERREKERGRGVKNKRRVEGVLKSQQSRSGAR